MGHQSDNEKDGHFEPPYAELEAVRVESSSFIGRRIMFWAVRWTLGFFIIWAIVSYYPYLYWLWWVGIGAAALSLAFLLVGEWWLNRKIDQTEARVRDLVEAIAEIDGDDAPDDRAL